jgi:hypothetical protein
MSIGLPRLPLVVRRGLLGQFLCGETDRHPQLHATTRPGLGSHQT